MTTIRQLITDAFRESGVIGVGVDPDAEEHVEGLRHVNRLFRSLLGNELGEPLQAAHYDDVILLTYVPSNVRVVVDLAAPGELNLNENPRDGARFSVSDIGGNLATNNLTVYGNGRLIEENDSLVLNTNNLNREWFYRADTSNWVRVTDLAADDLSPFPEEFDDLITTMLAIRLNPRYGGAIDEGLVAAMKRSLRQFRARYRQSNQETVDDGIVRLSSSKGYWSYENLFNIGI